VGAAGALAVEPELLLTGATAPPAPGAALVEAAAWTYCVWVRVTYGRCFSVGVAVAAAYLACWRAYFSAHSLAAFASSLALAASLSAKSSAATPTNHPVAVKAPAVVTPVTAVTARR
jgi:hypothetical protein